MGLKLRSAVVAVLVGVLALAGCGATRPQRTTKRAPARPAVTSHHAGFTPAPAAVAIAARLPLASQVAQLFMVSMDGTSPAGAPSGLGATDWGGVVLDSSNFSSDAQLKALVDALAARTRTGHMTPMLIGATQEGGPQTAFKDLPPRGEAALGAAGDPSQARAQAIAAGRALRRFGIEMTLAPLADVDIPEGPLSGRLFSSDPQTVAQFTAAAVGGYAQAGLIDAVGHFPGSGAASADPDQMTATVGGTIAALRGRDLIPFVAVAHSAPVMLMSNAAYAGFDGVTPASLLPQAVSLLRVSLGFTGVVMSDDLDATLQPTDESPGAVALQALEIGDDLLYITGPPSEHAAAYQGVLSAAQHSAGLRALLYQALLRDLTLKVRYGLLGGP